MKKLAVVSDIHGNIAALEKVVVDIKRRNVDRVINLGDNVSGPLWPKETIQYLMKQDWVHIKGNHDRQLVEPDPAGYGPSDAYAFKTLNDKEKKWLRPLPSFIEMPNGILLFHGLPECDYIYLLETVEHGRVRLATQAEINKRLINFKSPIMLCGHSHVPRVVKVTEQLLIINPGSVGLQAYDDHIPEYHIVETGSPYARYAILDYRNGNWIPELIAIPYDHIIAAKQARRNDRLDWEYALQTGFMQTR